MYKPFSRLVSQQDEVPTESMYVCSVAAEVAQCIRQLIVLSVPWSWRLPVYLRARLSFCRLCNADPRVFSLVDGRTHTGPRVEPEKVLVVFVCVCV